MFYFAKKYNQCCKFIKYGIKFIFKIEYKALYKIKYPIHAKRAYEVSICCAYY